MPEGALLRLMLEVHSGAEPITGRLMRADGTAADFTGWVELTAALEEARSGGSLPGKEADG